MPKNGSVFFILISIICVIYSGTLSYPWHFDDTPNILQNPKIQIRDLSPATLLSTLKGAPFSSAIDRPVAYFSLAINWYFGQKNTLGYHLFNILVHLLTALTLFKTISLLFLTPRLKDKYSSRQVLNIGLLSALLWAIHPIQTQAVTYIVQRMASLAALFYILAIFWYLKSRFEATFHKKIAHLTISILCFFLALGSKQNAALLPVLLLVIEIAFFPTVIDAKSKIYRSILIAVNIVIFAVAIYYIYSSILIQSIFSPFDYQAFFYL